MKMRYQHYGIRNTTRKIIVIPKIFFEYVKGVGNIGRGWITSPMIQDVWFANGSYCDFGFNNQYDLNGNIIYSGKGIVADISMVKSDNNLEEPMYDILGREIANPQPGTIYIQNGRKYIAR